MNNSKLEGWAMALLLIGGIIMIAVQVYEKTRRPKPDIQYVLVAFHLQPHRNGRQTYDVPVLQMQNFKAMATCKQALDDIKSRLAFGKCYTDTEGENDTYTYSTTK